MMNRRERHAQGGYPASDLGSYFPPGRHSAPHHHTSNKPFQRKPRRAELFRRIPTRPARLQSSSPQMKGHEPDGHSPATSLPPLPPGPSSFQIARISQSHMRSTPKYGRLFDCRTPEGPPLPARSEASQEPALRHRAHIQEPQVRQSLRPKFLPS